MKNAMAIANLGIINDLKQFLHETSEIKQRREQYCTTSTSFIRKRVLTFSILAVMIINMFKRSLTVELQCFFEEFSLQKDCSKQAFSAQRQKLKPQFYYDWNQVLVKVIIIITTHPTNVGKE